ncbi:hypothetical protein JAAARDRAFT_32200 [Jaapia argillacea MUCL 33604]|uniref:Uncharacterized protein n=1 Tax=Jaapia argillacea MUCL 33604 TaxID=933084 RepID=A0A067QCH1_9AGAM|nr:hypothetical protein JAAARDRAFT_32200 [Jaapia argillacea MUCL 33604]
MGSFTPSLRLLERALHGGNNVSILTYIISENNDPPTLSYDNDHQTLPLLGAIMAPSFCAAFWYQPILLTLSGVSLAAYYIIEYILVQISEIAESDYHPGCQSFDVGISNPSQWFCRSYPYSYWAPPPSSSRCMVPIVRTHVLSIPSQSPF